MLTALVLLLPIGCAAIARRRLGVLGVTVAMTWASAALANELRSGSERMFFYLVLPVVAVFVSTIVVTVLSPQPRLRQVLLWSTAGYVLGLVIRAVVPPCDWALDVAAPAIYTASAAVWASNFRHATERPL